MSTLKRIGAIFSSSGSLLWLAPILTLLIFSASQALQLRRFKAEQSAFVGSGRDAALQALAGVLLQASAVTSRPVLPCH